jgi:hypothetical protein
MGRTTCEQHQKIILVIRARDNSKNPTVVNPHPKILARHKDFLHPKKITCFPIFAEYLLQTNSALTTDSVPLQQSPPRSLSSNHTLVDALPRPSTKRSNSKHPQIRLITQKTEKEKAFPREDTTERRSLGDPDNDQMGSPIKTRVL